MRLDRNLNSDGKGKYALVLLRNTPPVNGQGMNGVMPHEVTAALNVLGSAGMLDYGNVGTDREFMVMRLKDKYTLKGLQGYFNAVTEDDPIDTDYAKDILDMMSRAGPNSKWCKKPD